MKTQTPQGGKGLKITVKIDYMQKNLKRKFIYNHLNRFLHNICKSSKLALMTDFAVSNDLILLLFI